MMVPLLWHPKKMVIDQDVSRRELVKVVVIHEYPLSIVDHIGFRSFVKSLNDNFKMISRNTLKSDVLRMYNNGIGSLKDLLMSIEGRVAITTNMWTASNQKKGYMAVTSHFIDDNWVLHNRTIRSKRQKVRTTPLRGDVDNYLENATMPEDKDFNVLNWWKNDTNCPTLKKIAKDILTISVSSVSSESAFSMGGRVISAHPSRLHSHTVEALMCLQSRLVDDVKGTLEGKYSCSTIDEDCDSDIDAQDIIDMDVDDVSSDED